MKLSKLFIVWALLSSGLNAVAQIGYQISLLNSATGEPRSNETVLVELEITNSANQIIYKESISSHTNEFGILALQVGNEHTFQNIDWSKLPLYVSATVDGILIGKSQILNVPIAEAAKTLVGLSKDNYIGKWTGANQEVVSAKDLVITFNKDGTYTMINPQQWGDEYNEFTNIGIYEQMGNVLLCLSTNGCGMFLAYYQVNGDYLNISAYTCKGYCQDGEEEVQPYFEAGLPLTLTRFR
jgi:hypothetical protein